MNGFTLREREVDVTATGQLLLKPLMYFWPLSVFLAYKSFKKRNPLALRVTTSDSRNLDVFRSTVEVMLADGRLTREEKRLTIKLASALNLTEDQPALIYKAIQDGETSPSGELVSVDDAREIYTKVFEVAIVNASLSRDEFRVLAHLRSVFEIDDDEHESIETQLREIVKEKFEDPTVVDKMLHTLRDSVGLVGDIFDTVRKRASDGGRSE